MQFEKDYQLITLKADTDNELAWVQGEKMAKMLQKPSQLSGMQCFTLHVQFSTSNTVASLPEVTASLPTDLVNVLSNFVGVFQEPTSLPPHRGHYHQIPFKEGTNPINTRTYRYKSIQKDVIEKITSELLESVVILASPLFPSRLL